MDANPTPKMKLARKRAERWFYNYLAGDWTDNGALEALTYAFLQAACPHNGQIIVGQCQDCHGEIDEQEAPDAD